MNTEEKKVYRKLDSSPLSESISKEHLSKARSSSAKKIIPSTAGKGMREEFKKTFLPLLIDIFELRQMIESHKAQKDSPIPLSHKVQPPEEILKRLEQMQNEIEEAQKWCDGVVMQISKGITEAKEILVSVDQLPTTTPKKRLGFLKRLLRLKR